MHSSNMVLVYLVVLISIAQFRGAFGFVPTVKSIDRQLSSRSSHHVASEQGKGLTLHSCNGELITDDDGSFAIASSRRDAIKHSLSLVAINSCLPSHNAYAEDTTSTPTAADPFNVIFTIQLDPTKPEELLELEVECIPEWAPLASQRFRELVELGFYTNSPFFRVLPNFIAQFGISADPKLNKQWMYCDTTTAEDAIKLCQQPLPDEPRKVPNKAGTLSFASSGKNSRRTQIFINSRDNSGPPNFLDGQGFVPFARIVRGEDIVKGLNSEYGGKVSQGKGAYYGGEYFEKVFPRLSVIRDAKIV